MNYLHRWIIIGIVSAGICGTSWAATVVERRDTQGNKQKITMDEQYAYVENPKVLNFYMLINLEEEKVYMVNDKDKRFVKMDIIGKPHTPPKDMPRHFPKPPWGKFVEAELIPKGEGPQIAGYPTKRYEIKAHGRAQGRAWDRTCSDNYFSKQAFEVAYLNKFLEAMYQMSNSRQPKIKGMPIHPCQQAHEELENKFRKLGIPMKAMLKGGKKNRVRHEIISIKTDVKISANLFTLPTGYERITEQEMIEEQQAAMKKLKEKFKQREGYSGRDYGRERVPPRNYEQPNNYHYSYPSR
jgi:hypothetical protein